MNTLNNIKTTSKAYTPNDIFLLKGVGILLIVLHNYFHWTPKSSIENEFIYFSQNIEIYLNQSFTNLKNFINLNFSFWGHLGVQLFVFASGYGLYKSYEKNPVQPFKFLTKKLISIFCLLLIGILAVCCLRYFNDGSVYHIKSIILIFFKKATTIDNFSFKTIFNFSGPYWYFGLTIQLYLIFPILFKIIHKNSKSHNQIIIATLLVVNLLLYPLSRLYNFPYNGICLGHLPEFLLGLYLAKNGINDNIKTNVVSGIVSLIILIISQFNEYVFPVSFLAATIFMLSLFNIGQKIKINLPPLNKLFLFIGKISMGLFIINGALRELSLFRNENRELLNSKIIIFLPILFILAYILAYCYKLFNNISIKLINKIVK